MGCGLRAEDLSEGLGFRVLGDSISSALRVPRRRSLSPSPQGLSPRTPKVFLETGMAPKALA